MFPSCALSLFGFVGLLLCFPLCKFLPSLFALEKHLYLRKKDAVQGFCFPASWQGSSFP